MRSTRTSETHTRPRTACRRHQSSRIPGAALAVVGTEATTASQIFARRLRQDKVTPDAAGVAAAAASRPLAQEPSAPALW